LYPIPKNSESRKKEEQKEEQKEEYKRAGNYDPYKNDGRRVKT
jgi:hypothetical protein